MIIAIDVGNTHIVMGCLDKDNIYFAARVSTDRVKTEDEYAITLKNLFQIKGFLRRMWREELSPLLCLS